MFLSYMHCDDKRTLFVLKQEIEKTWDELKKIDFNSEGLINKLSEEIQEYFENLQDQTLSEHPEIEFDNIMEEYIDDNFTKLYEKYFNNEKKLVHFIDFETGYFKHWGNQINYLFLYGTEKIEILNK